jgi:hypothetical protein
MPALIAPLASGSELTIVALTLAIAALFNPLQRCIQELTDKRFERRTYDTPTCWQPSARLPLTRWVCGRESYHQQARVTPYTFRLTVVMELL